MSEIAKKLYGEIEVDDDTDMLFSSISISGDHIKGYDNWITHNSGNNISSQYLEIGSKELGTYCTIHFSNLEIVPPRYIRGNVTRILTPQYARENKITYAADWYIDIEFWRNGVNDSNKIVYKKVCIGSVPVMTGSVLCHLRGKTPEQLLMMGEDPTDFFGYFIIEGVEKVCRTQELLSTGKILLVEGSKIEDSHVRLVSNTPKGTNLIRIVLGKKNKVIKVELPSMKPDKVDEADAMKKKSINVLKIYRIFETYYGLKGLSDPERIKEIICLFIPEKYQQKCMLRLSQGFTKYYTDVEDNVYIANKMTRSDQEKVADPETIRNVIDTDLFPQILASSPLNGETASQTQERIEYMRIYQLSIMVARMLMYVCGFQAADNRDSWSNKRLDSSPQLVEKLLKSAWKSTLVQVLGNLPSPGNINDADNIVNLVKSNSLITSTFHSSFHTPNWGVKGSKMKTAVAEALSQESRVSRAASLGTIDVGISRTDKNHKIRQIQKTQVGFICLVHTQEGENVGIVKNKTLTSSITEGKSDSDVVPYIDGTIGPIRFSPLYGEFKDPLMLSGNFVGWCDSDSLEKYLKQLRRDGKIPKDSTIIHDQGARKGDIKWLHIDLSASRIVRPVYLMDMEKQVPLIDLHGGPKGKNLNDLVEAGFVEYLSPWEQEHSMIAINRQQAKEKLDQIETSRLLIERLRRSNEKDDLEVEIENLKNLESIPKYEYCEISNQFLFGATSSIVPLPNHQPFARVIFDSLMSRHALPSVVHRNWFKRFDSDSKVLAYSTRPLIDTFSDKLLGTNNFPMGNTLGTAYLSCAYGEDDGFLTKKEFFERGGYRMFKYIYYKTSLKHGGGDVTERLAKPSLSKFEKASRYQYINSGASDPNLAGLPMIGAPLKTDDCVIGLYQTINKRERNTSIYMQNGDEGVVDGVSVTTNNKKTTVFVRIRKMHIGDVGDKFSGRNAQKGTNAISVPTVDLPFDENGFVPDKIINGLSYIGRTTHEHMIEILATQRHAIEGTRGNGSHMADPDYENMLDVLEKNGIPYAERSMRFGPSGEMLKGKVTFGLCYYRALKHWAEGKLQYRGHYGPIDQQTRQPNHGKKVRGGLRFGEMERDAIISHGCPAILRERFMKTSDAYLTAFCLNCSTFAVNDVGNPTGFRDCPFCGQNNFGRTEIPYATKLLGHTLSTMSIRFQIKVVTQEEYHKQLKNEEVTEGDEYEDEEEEIVEEYHDYDDDE